MGGLLSAANAEHATDVAGYRIIAQGRLDGKIRGCMREKCAGAPDETNPALRLYRRLGFAIAHENERKFYMRRERDAAAPPRR